MCGSYVKIGIEREGDWRWEEWKTSSDEKWLLDRETSRSLMDSSN